MTIQIEKYRQKNAHKDVIIKIQYSPTGNYLVSTDRSGEIIVWSENKLWRNKRIYSPYAPLTGVWFSEDENLFLAGYQGGHLLAYSLPKFKPEAEVQLKTNRPEGYILQGALKPVLDYVILATCPLNDANIYVVLEFRDFFMVQRETFQVTNYVHVSGNLIECAVASLNGRFVFFGDDLGYIYRFKLPEMKLEIYAEHHELVPGYDLDRRSIAVDRSSGITGLALSHDGKLVASTSRTGGVQIWQTEVNRQEDIELRKFQPFVARKPIRYTWLRGVCFLPNSTTLALGDDDGIVEVWDYQSEQTIHIAKCPSSVRSLNASPDGSQLAIGCEDGNVFIIPWDASSHSKAS
jgi:WD40 repeat protein